MSRLSAVSVLTLVACLALAPTVPAVSQTSSVGVTVYLTVDQPEGGPYIAPVHREVEDTPAVAEAAITALLEGATDAESAGIPSLGSEIPPGTVLHGVSIADGVATVDLSGHFDDGGGTATMLTRLAQVVFTVTQFPTVDGMLLELDGVPVDVFSSEGLVLDGPVRRDWFDGTGVLPPVFVDQPSWGGPFAARFVGISTVTDVRLTIVDADGLILTEADVRLPTAGTSTPAPFDVTLPYVSLTAQPGAVMAADPSDRGATVVEHPVTLAPTPVATARTTWRVCPDDATSGQPFEDVPATGAHADAIACMVSWELVQGISEVSYAPDRAVTRGQMASFVDRLMTASGQPLPTTDTDRFVDDDASVHAPAIDRLAAAGLVEGVTLDRYAPGQAVTRAQAASMLWRAHEHLAAEALTATTDYFDDDSASTHQTAIDGLALAGVVAGRDGEFRPAASVTRAQMASVLARTLDLLEEQHAIP